MEITRILNVLHACVGSYNARWVLSPLCRGCREIANGSVCHECVISAFAAGQTHEAAAERCSILSGHACLRILLILEQTIILDQPGVAVWVWLFLSCLLQMFELDLWWVKRLEAELRQLDSLSCMLTSIPDSIETQEKHMNGNWTMSAGGTVPSGQACHDKDTDSKYAIYQPSWLGLTGSQITETLILSYAMSHF